MTTKSATYKNSGSMNDYLKFLMANAEDQNDVSFNYRCYCKVLHEYQEFLWYDENLKPHIIDGCDAFVEYTEKIEENEDNLYKKNIPNTMETLQKTALHNGNN